MCQFILGWRRKTGVLMLLVASVFATGWIRGMMVYDVVKFAIGNHQFVMMGIDSAIILESGKVHRDATQWSWTSVQPTKRLLTGDEIARIRGIAYEGAPFHCHLFTWIIAIPLAAISAYLLILAKPCHSKLKNAPELIVNEEASF